MLAKRCFVQALAAMSLAAVCSAQAPAVYQDLYAQLARDVADFQNAIHSASNGTAFPVRYGGQLTDANCNNGPALLQPSSAALIDSEILLLKAVGVRAVSVEVSYPMLDPAFFAFIGHPEYQPQFAAFYANVAASIRAQGMQVIVESQSMIPTGLQSVWGSQLQAYYATLTTFQAYTSARAQAAGIVAQTMRPDYFVLQEEPDTESAQSGQASAGTVSGSTSMLDATTAAARQAGVAGMKIGAGFGTWLQAYPLFANSFTRQHCGQIVNGQPQPCLSQSLDFLDLHVFPITEQTAACSAPPNPKPCTAPNFWQNAMAVVAAAKAAGVPLSISQTWLRKVRDGEWLQIDGDVQEAREAYSFWAPLDLQFLQTIHDLANYAQMLFVVPFNTQSDSAYLTWSSGTALRNEGGSNTEAQVFAAVQSAAIANAAAASYTSVATGFHNLIVSDAAPPSSPSNVVATRTTPAEAMVSWSAAADDVGVAGYHVLRNGGRVADVFQSPFHDTGLSAGTVYTYQVQAFDLAGNVSAAASSSQGRRRAAVHN